MVAPTYFKFYQTIVGNELARSVYNPFRPAKHLPSALGPWPSALTIVGNGLARSVYI